MRPAKIAVLAAALLLALPAYAQDDAPLGERLVDQMNQLFGRHPGLRAMHAKGVVVEGTFTPSPEAATLSTASLFQGGTTPVTARFSDGTGLPMIPDGDPNANPHGLGLRFQLADGGQLDMVTNSLPFFPVADGETFLALLQAVAASGPGTPKPTPLERFVADHPSVPAATGGLATPAGYGRETYNGINAFVLVDAKGERRPVRFRLDPVAGDADLGREEAAKQPPDFLADGLIADLAKEPVRFRLLAQLAAQGDQTTDPSKPWPADRPLALLGEIALTRPAADQAAAARDLMLLPSNLTDGIEPSDDPMIDVRDETYAVSFSRRSE